MEQIIIAAIGTLGTVVLGMIGYLFKTRNNGHPMSQDELLRLTRIEVKLDMAIEKSELACQEISDVRDKVYTHVASHQR